MTYYTGPKTLRNKLNEWFAKQNHIKLPKNAISKLYVSVAEAWTPAKLFPTGTEEGLLLDFADISTLYTDRTFSTNISAIGDPVGGVLDKSKGLVLGAEKLTNGGFDTDLTGWTAAAGFSVSGGKLIGATSGDKIYQAAGITAGEVYSFTITGVVGEWGVRLGQDAANDYTITADGTYFITPGTLYSTTDFRLRVNIAGSELASISVKKLSGNHLIQATSTARPIWTRHPKSGVRNRFDATNNLTSAVWSSNNGATKTDVTGSVAPPSALPSDASVARWTAPTGSGEVLQSIDDNVLGQYYVTSIWAKSVSGSDHVFNIFGPVTADGEPRTATSEWQRFEITNSSVVTGVRFPGIKANDTEGFLDIYVCAPQYEASNNGSAGTATDYQTRVSKYDVTEAGVDDCYGLTFDGVDDYLVTAANLDLSGTAEINLTFGEYNNSSFSGSKRVFDFGGTNVDGGFQIYSPYTPNNQERVFRSRGGVTAGQATASKAIPAYGVVTGFADHTIPSRTIRIDGADVATDTNGTTGTFSAQEFVIGSNAAYGTPFLGTIYGVTLTDYTLDAEQLAELETWTAARTPEVTLA